MKFPFKPTKLIPDIEIGILVNDRGPNKKRNFINCAQSQVIIL